MDFRELFPAVRERDICIGRAVNIKAVELQMTVFPDMDIPDIQFWQKHADQVQGGVLFIPAFGDGTGTAVTLSALGRRIQLPSLAVILVMILNGIAGVIISGRKSPGLDRILLVAGMVFSIIGVMLFIMTRQPYAGIICFALFVIKGVLVIMLKR